MRLDANLMGRLAADEALWRDFNDICDCGGRLSGTESEKKAFALLRERVRAASPANSGRSIPVPYNGWQAKAATLELPGGSFAPCHPLVRTIATPGLTAEVIDLGRGTPDEFEAHKAEIAGRIVLVRHELMFAAGTIHRRRKYDMARAHGAVGFLIGGPLAGHVVAGSSGRDSGEGIPALGISPETAAKLVDYAQAFGVTMEELAEAADPRLWKLLHRAWKADQTADEAAAAKAREVRPAVSVAGASGGVGGLRDELAAKEWMRRRNAQAMGGR